LDKQLFKTISYHHPNGGGKKAALIL